jgi:hypothetical protein
MNRDKEHLRLLSIFHYVCAGLAALFASVFVIYAIMGLVMALRPDAFGPAKDQPPAFIGWLFFIIGAGGVTLGWVFAGLLAWAGRCLSRCRHYTFCLVMASFACLFMPFGTVLGVFTIIVLIRPSVKALFESPAPS